MSTTDPVPPLVAKLAGTELAMRVRGAAVPAAALWRHLEAFVDGEHGDALREFWAVEEQAGKAADEVGAESHLYGVFMDFDAATSMLCGFGNLLERISPFVAEVVGLSRATDAWQEEIERMVVAVENLIDAGEVADVLGLARRQAVSTYRSRYGDFPEPIVTKNSGMCDLWLRADVEAWKASRAHRSPQ